MSDLLRWNLDDRTPKKANKQRTLARTPGYNNQSRKMFQSIRFTSDLSFMVTCVPAIRSP